MTAEYSSDFGDFMRSTERVWLVTSCRIGFAIQSYLSFPSGFRKYDMKGYGLGYKPSPA